VPEADAKLQAGVVVAALSSRTGDQVLTQIFRVEHEAANNLVAILRPLISPNNTITANAGNNTLVITEYADNLRRLGRIIAAVDLLPGAQIALVPLQHAVAADLLPLLQKLLETPAAGPTASGALGASIQIDTRTNALMLHVANPSRLTEIRSLIAQLDQPVERNGGAGASTESNGQISVGEGLNLALIRDYGSAYGLAAIARLLQSQTSINIVSTPNLIMLDNEEAKIVVGSNVPFITVQTAGLGGGGAGGATTSPFQTIERKDVGIALRIKPQINIDGTVRMTIFQESSSLSEKVAPGTSNAGPSTDKRSIETNVVVDGGQIVVLGGLIEDKSTERKSKIPLLGDIPGLGALFRSESRTKTRTNLMVFLRPVVMPDQSAVSATSIQRYHAAEATPVVPTRMGQ
jgi:type II secretory pathway component GspD/PulD (secretin)